jgi:hypothetical protein
MAVRPRFGSGPALPAGSTGVPHQLPLAAALRGSEPLTSLLQRLRQSQARLETIRPGLPEALWPAVQPGPVDDAGWSLLVSNPAAAAKLRQLLPQLQEQLAQAGWAPLPIRLRVQATHR